MSENTCESAVCTEKFKSYDREIVEIKINVSAITNKLNEIDKKTDAIESTITGKFNQLETKFEIYNGITFKKLEELERKIDRLTSSDFSEKKPVQVDTFRVWLEKMGMKVLEYGIFAGILYGVGKGIKIF